MFEPINGEVCPQCEKHERWIEDLENQVQAMAGVVSAAIEANLALGTEQDWPKAFQILNFALCAYEPHRQKFSVDAVEHSI